MPNGLKVTLVQYGAIPKVEIALSVRAGNLNDLKSHMSSALDSVEQQRTLDARARAEIHLAIGEGARALATPRRAGTTTESC